MEHMKRALFLARQAIGISSPNPPVGALVVKDDRILGEGHTLAPGEAHAEITALNQAGIAAKGATLYTTLEPCCHFGRTPPCTKSIIKSGIREVKIVMLDPNPVVNGKGIAELKNAGIVVHIDDSVADEAEEIAEAYLKFTSSGFPFVTAKFAMSLDGKIATASGDSKWITSEDSRKQSRILRGQADAVVVGIGTVIKDNPRLTVRDESDLPSNDQPVRIVVDSNARVPLESKLLAEPGLSIIATSQPDIENARRLSDAGVEIIRSPGNDGNVDLHYLLASLAARGITSVLVEGGGILLGSFFDLGLVDKVVAFISPVIIGGEGTQSPVKGIGATTMSDALQLKRSSTYTIGKDLVMTGYVR